MGEKDEVTENGKNKDSYQGVFCIRYLNISKIMMESFEKYSKQSCNHRRNIKI